MIQSAHEKAVATAVWIEDTDLSRAVQRVIELLGQCEDNALWINAWCNVPNLGYATCARVIELIVCKVRGHDRLCEDEGRLCQEESDRHCDDCGQPHD